MQEIHRLDLGLPSSPFQAQTNNRFRPCFAKENKKQEETMIKVLIVDDSALMRKNMRLLLERDPDIAVIGTARDGEDAIVKYQELQPDVVTMDVNMPKMDGLTSLQYIIEGDPDARILLVSSITEEGAAVTFEALALGALDFVLKPGGTVSLNMASVAKEIIGKVKELSRVRRGKRISLQEKIKQRVPKKVFTGDRIVVIGVSTGGPKTLLDIVPKLPATLKAPVLVVQHMPGNFTPSFAARLDQNSPIPFKEAAAGDPLLPGHGYLAPGGMHMILAPMAGESGFRIRLTKSPIDTTFRPSVDVTMESAFKHFGARTVGVILTGMGNDGARAMELIHGAGGLTIAEDESTAIVYGMPREVIEQGHADLILPCHEIGLAIAKAVGA
jgi:two-component system chemotaxis response regulator CheB